jgi:hypothetical protein
MCKEKRKNIKEKKRKNKMRARKCVFGLVFMAFDWILWPLVGFGFIVFGWLFILQIALYCIYGDVMIDLNYLLHGLLGVFIYLNLWNFFRKKRLYH